jgi:hypothetical protein
MGGTTPSPETIILLEFEAALRDALNNERNLRFPGARIGPKYFLQIVEDLSWLLTRRTRKETADYLFITLVVPFFAFPRGSATCLNHDRGWEISMPETG